MKKILMIAVAATLLFCGQTVSAKHKHHRGGGSSFFGGFTGGLVGGTLAGAAQGGGSRAEYDASKARMDVEQMRREQDQERYNRLRNEMYAQRGISGTTDLMPFFILFLVMLFGGFFLWIVLHKRKA